MKTKHYAVFFLGLIIFTTLWVQVKINSHLPTDIPIYLYAGYEALNNQNAYQPFEIGSSFIYPPTALLVFVPLQKTDHPIAIWTAINIISMLLSILLIFKLSPNQIGQPTMKYLVVGTIFYAPFWEQLTIGQVNSLVLLGIALFILGVSDPRYNWIGDFGLAVAISIKISPILLVAYPLLRSDWQRLIRISLYLLFLATLSIFLFGLPTWFDFLKILPEVARGYPGMNNQTVDTLVKWLAGSAAEWIRPLFSTFALVFWIVALVRSRKRVNATAVLNFGIVTMTVSSSLIWYHHHVFLLAPIVYLLLSTQKESDLGNAILFLTLSGTALINSNRVLEYLLNIPPIAAISGYLMMYLASALNLFYIPGKNQKLSINQIEV